MRGRFIDFLVIVALCHAVIGFTIIRAEEPVLKKALALVNEGRAEEAISMLNQDLRTSQATTETHLGLGVAYLQKGDLSAARLSLEQAISMRPDSVPAHYTLAMLFEKQRDFARAAIEWRKVLQHTDDPDLKDLANKHLQQLESRQ